MVCLPTLNKDVAIIGAGAAGMMCAIEAGKRKRQVILLDHARVLAEKIRISGGGRCNFTNRHTKAENYISSNPHFCRSALARYTPQDFIAMLEKHGIRYHEKKLGQLFCDDSAEQIIGMLREECSIVSIQWQMPTQILEIQQTGLDKANREPSSRFKVITERNIINTNSLVIATGGLSIPQIGASALGYRIAEQFSIALVPMRPALVSLQFAEDDFAVFKGMAGIAIDAEIHLGKIAFRENLLFTHRGISGPAVLQISSYWTPGVPIRIDLLPGQHAVDIFAPQRQSSMLLSNVLARVLPRRFIQAWLDLMTARLGIAIKPMNQYRERELQAIVDQLHHWTVKPTGTVGYRKAEVTLGGVDTRELSSQTMESKRIPGLYFIGEVVDVTGQLGGFNFQWAWSSGYAAGQVV